MVIFEYSFLNCELIMNRQSNATHDLLPNSKLHGCKCKRQVYGNPMQLMIYYRTRNCMDTSASGKSTAGVTSSKFCCTTYDVTYTSCSAED